MALGGDVGRTLRRLGGSVAVAVLTAAAAATLARSARVYRSAAAPGPYDPALAGPLVVAESEAGLVTLAGGATVTVALLTAAVTGTRGRRRATLAWAAAGLTAAGGGWGVSAWGWAHLQRAAARADTAGARGCYVAAAGAASDSGPPAVGAGLREAVCPVGSDALRVPLGAATESRRAPARPAA